MAKVIVLQTDNRPTLDYLLKTQEVNKKFCDILGYDYLFVELDDNEYGNIHPATKKIHVVNDVLQHKKYDIIVFLDSDAWIQNGFHLHNLINRLLENENKYGCFSRDPYLKHNTFINSGSFILKVNNYTKEMYHQIINDLYNNTDFQNNWPYDQYYISKYIFENKDKFDIFIPDILNTPHGKILKHNWCKNERMYHDLDLILSLTREELLLQFNIPLVFQDYYDKEIFPNIMVDGYYYQD